MFRREQTHTRKTKLWTTLTLFYERDKDKNKHSNNFDTWTTPNPLEPKPGPQVNWKVQRPEQNTIDNIFEQHTLQNFFQTP